MLLARDAHSSGVDLGEHFHMRGRVVDRDAKKRRLRQTGHNLFARGAKKINWHLGKEAVPDVEALRDTVEGESDECLMRRS
jgi:hypothetical protein